MATEIPPKPTLEELRYVVNNFPIIDNHAHNLLLPTYIDTVPFETITSEAQGRALRDTFKSLPHLRAARQLRELYECRDDADWEDVLEQRVEWLRSNPERLYQKCFHGMHALLMDDGLSGPEKVYEFNWHDRCAKAPTKRIVRIETVAERLMESITIDADDADLKHTKFITDTWLTFTEEFEREIQEAIQDPDVAGFKSVICYRTGLDIEPDYERAAREVGHPFERYVERCIRKRKYRIERKSLNDYLVLRTLEILSERLPHPEVLSKPLQFHTGLGDNDISLRQSNPAYMQSLIENYSRVPFVLLHSAYPYTREAGYLTTVYKHVYLDIGEVFPMVSRDGQLAVLRQVLELVPGSKILYSTDGHFFPETYWLANKQFREVWLDLLVEYVNKEDLTPHQAINITKDVLFNNANILYDLRYQPDFVDPVPAPSNQQSIAWHPKVTEPTSPSPQPPPFPPPPKSATSASEFPPPFPPPPKVPQVYDLNIFEEFTKSNPEVQYIYVQWLDYMATLRTRIVPIREFDRLIHAGERIGISQGNTGTLQNDAITPVVNTTGQIYVEPDLRSLRRTPKSDPLLSATVLSYWRDETGRPLRSCPRSNLETLINDLQFNHNISLLCGFEIEVTFLTRQTTNINQDNNSNSNSNSNFKPTTTYHPLTQNHAWGTLTPEQLHTALPLLAEIATALTSTGIPLQQFHSESGPGQYEFILPPLPPLSAIDTLLQTRQIISQIAASHGLRATLHPQPFTSGASTAAHAHISLSPPDRDMQFFVGGVLRHVPALMGFTMPEAPSYSRVVDDGWSGGTWIAWGTQNREVPLRRVGSGHWEMRCLDGFANMYFAIGAVVAAGLLGLKENQTEFVERDVLWNPSGMSEEQREEMGVRERMPRSVEEALVALDGDVGLGEMLAEGLVKDYLRMKRVELRMIEDMGEEEGRSWLIEKY